MQNSTGGTRGGMMHKIIKTTDKDCVKVKMSRKITTLVTVFAMLFQISLPVMAAVLPNEVIEIDLDSNSQFERVSEYYAPQYIAASYLVDTAPAAQNLDGFYQSIRENHRYALGEPTLVPIRTAGITTVIPVDKKYKFVGDSFVQSRYIRAQIRGILGRNLINSDLDPVDGINYTNEMEQLNTLYGNALTYIADRGDPSLIFGKKLSRQQDASGLSGDMVWPELRTINGEEVIVPIVYLTQSTVNARKVDGHITEFNGSVIFGDVLIEDVDIQFGREAFIAAANLLNNQGTLEGVDDLTISVSGTLTNLSGLIQATGDLNIGAHNIINQTIVHRYDFGAEQGTRFGEVASFESTTGDVLLRSYGDILFQGANVSALQGGITFAADGSIYIGSQQVTSTFAGTEDGWNVNRSNVDYLQSTITAEETIQFIANSEIVIDAAEITSNQGHIEMLAGLGITIEGDLSQSQSYQTGKFGKKSVQESTYQTVAIRALLDAGEGIRLHTEFGDITLNAADITSADGTSVNAANGGVNLLMTTETDHYSYSSVKEKLFTTKTINAGHEMETGVPNTIVGGFAVEALTGLKVEYEGNPDLTLDEQIAELAQFGGLEWMAEVKANTQDVDWAAIELQYDTWRDTNRSISPAFAAVISIAAAIASGGGTSGWLEAALTAGIVSLSSQAAVALANGIVNHDIGQALDDLASSETFKSLAIAMVTAGALNAIDAEFFKIGQNAGLTQQVGQAVTHAAVQAGVELAIEGESFSEFDNLIIQNLKQHGIDVLGQHMATKIGDAFDGADATNLDTALKYISHAGSGCALGVLSATNSGEINTNTACASGAGGAVVGEVIGSIYRTSEDVEKANASVDEFVQKNGELVSRLRAEDYSNEQIYELLSSKSMASYYAKEIQQLKNDGVDLARLGAAVAAFLAGADAEGVNIAADFGENAAENNALATLSFSTMLIDSISKFNQGAAANWEDMLGSSKNITLTDAARAAGWLLIADFILSGTADSIEGALGVNAYSYFSLLQDDFASLDDIAIAQAAFANQYSSYLGMFGRSDLEIVGANLNGEQYQANDEANGVTIYVNPGSEIQLPIITVTDDNGEATPWITITPVIDEAGLPSIYVTPEMTTDLKDYILVFPPESGVPPLHVVYSEWGKGVRGEIDIPSSPGYAKHHLIGIENAGKYPAIKNAIDSGVYDINRPENGMSLPSNYINGGYDVEWGLQESLRTGLPYHGGRHDGAYDRYVEQKLNAIQIDYDAGIISDSDLPSLLTTLESEIRFDLENDNVRLQNNDPR